MWGTPVPGMYPIAFIRTDRVWPARNRPATEGTFAIRSPDPEPRPRPRPRPRPDPLPLALPSPHPLILSASLALVSFCVRPCLVDIRSRYTGSNGLPKQQGISRGRWAHQGRRHQMSCRAGERGPPLKPRDVEPVPTTHSPVPCAPICRWLCRRGSLRPHRGRRSRWR